MRNAIDGLLEGYAHEKHALEAEIEVKRGQLRDYQDRIGREFEHERYRSQLADLQDELKVGQSDGASEEAKGKVGELAERIRDLRGLNEVEAAPERTGARKVARAERPVTARIRERLVERPAAAEAESQADEAKPEPVTAPQPVAEVIPLPVKSVEEKPEDDTPPGNASGVVMPAMYQERGQTGRVAMRQQDDGGQLRLF